MTIVPLQTYLRTYRKRAGFTHDEVAFLCGGMNGAGMSRHETANRLPTLRVALFYEFILGASVSELFEGLFHEVRGIAQARAKGLLKSLEREPATPARDYKVTVLRMLIEERTG
jgi:hypothetical protein